MRTIEFDGWIDGAPFIQPGGSNEFTIWHQGVPLFAVSSSGSPYDYRRRSHIM